MSSDNDGAPELGDEFFQNPILTQPGESLVESAADQRASRVSGLPVRSLRVLIDVANGRIRELAPHAESYMIEVERNGDMICATLLLELAHLRQWVTATEHLIDVMTVQV